MASGHGHGMIWTVLKWTLLAFLLALIIFWIFSGGFSAVARTARTLVNPLDLLGTGTTTGTNLRLPWQPAEQPARGPDISGYATAADQYQQTMSDEQSSDAQIRSFGNPSPYAGKLTISDNAATESDPQYEYLRIDLSSTASSPVTITGWSLQSAISRVRAYIPGGTSNFVQGSVNSSAPITLSPGDSAIITTGLSPVGISFRENKCSGYLASNQQFYPDLSNECPAPSDTLASAPSTVRDESACVDFIQNIPSCTTPRSVPSNLSQTCITYIANTFTYGGCAALYRGGASFALPSWRIFLNFRSELWSNTSDTLRLLDDQGRVVDVLSY